MEPSDEFYDAKVRILGEYVMHHIRQEEQRDGIFAQAKRGGEDLEDTGRRLAARKEELMSRFAGRYGD